MQSGEARDSPSCNGFHPRGGRGHEMKDEFVYCAGTKRVWSALCQTPRRGNELFCSWFPRLDPFQNSRNVGCPSHDGKIPNKDCSCED